MPFDTRNRRLSVKRLASLCLTGLVWRGATAAEALAPWYLNIPKGYRQTFEDNGDTLVLTPAGDEQYVIRITYHSLKDYVKERPKVGRDFITHLARKKGMPLFPIDGNGGIAYLDVPVHGEQNGQKFQETAGGVGLDAAYATFSVIVDITAVKSPEVQELFRAGLRKVLGGIR